LLAHAQTKNDAIGEVQWEVVSVDDTVIRAHQHAAGARSRPSARTRKSAVPGVRDADPVFSTGRLTGGATTWSRGA
jgi:hypothetical protein